MISANRLRKYISNLYSVHIKLKIQIIWLVKVNSCNVTSWQGKLKVQHLELKVDLSRLTQKGIFIILKIINQHGNKRTNI